MASQGQSLRRTNDRSQIADHVAVWLEEVVKELAFCPSRVFVSRWMFEQRWVDDSIGQLEFLLGLVLCRGRLAGIGGVQEMHAHSACVVGRKHISTRIMCCLRVCHPSRPVSNRSSSQPIPSIFLWRLSTFGHQTHCAVQRAVHRNVKPPQRTTGIPRLSGDF